MEDKTPSGQPIVDREKVRWLVRSWNHPHLTGQKKRQLPFLYAPLSKLARSIGYPNLRMGLYHWQTSFRYSLGTFPFSHF
jgi:hypothetical protein